MLPLCKERVDRPSGRCRTNGALRAEPGDSSTRDSPSILQPVISYQKHRTRSFGCVASGSMIWRSLRKEYASAKPGKLWGSEAALFLHLAYGHGYLELPRKDASALRHLQIHHREIPVLQKKYAEVAELPQTQPLVQRLLHQNPPTG